MVSDEEKRAAWFEAGSITFLEGRGDADLLPPLHDMEAQRWWLGGFGAAWAEALKDWESVDDALVRALEGREELLRQLRSHRAEWGRREVH